MKKPKLVRSINQLFKLADEHKSVIVAAWGHKRLPAAFVQHIPARTLNNMIKAKTISIYVKH